MRSRTVRVEKCRPEHLDRMDLPADINRVEFHAYLASLLGHHKALSYALVIDETVVCLVGVVEIWSGVAESWAVVCADASRYALTINRVALRLIRAWFIDLKLHRLQATVQDGLTKNFRWCRSLGFEPESVMKHYGKKGEDFHMLVRLKWQ